MLRYLLPAILAVSLLHAVPGNQCVMPKIGNDQTLDWDGSITAALRQEEMNYYNGLYQLQAQLKSALLKYAMLQEQGAPDLTQLEQAVREINNVRLQMDLATINVESQIRSMLPLDQFKKWRATWQPPCGYEWSLLCNRNPNEVSEAVALWRVIQKLVSSGPPCPACSEATSDYVQRLPAESIQRAFQYSNSQ